MMDVNFLDDYDDVMKAIREANRKACLSDFAAESNRIEGITDNEALDDATRRLNIFLQYKKLTVKNVMAFNTAGVLRDKDGMNVFVGQHIPMEGGSEVTVALQYILSEAVRGADPYQMHRKFESLHPFMDGNGRTGRAIWLWQMVNQHDYDMSLGFLQMWYYQSLEDKR